MLESHVKKEQAFFKPFIKQPIEKITLELAQIRKDLIKFLSKHDLISKFTKQAKLFKANPYYPSLQTELLEPKHLRMYSFWIDRKYRAIFVYTDTQEVEIIDINRHL